MLKSVALSLRSLSLGFGTLLMLLCCALVSQAEEIKNSSCLECHEDKTLTKTNNGTVISLYVDVNKLAGSIHKTNSCASCHNDIQSSHPDDEVAAKPVQCARCHEKQSESYGASAHGIAQRKGTQGVAGCADCHGSHEVLSPASVASPLHFSNLTKTCGDCHSEVAADFAQSVHGKAIAEGRREAATCTDCHAEHKIETLKSSTPLKLAQDVCSKCHASERLNTKFQMPADRVKTFFDSYHGLAAQYGSTLAANCSSCHGVHKILPSNDPNSTIHQAHLVETCGKCHPGANEKFAQGKIHVNLAADNGGTGAGEQVNWWVRKIYLLLIVGTIGVMLAHNLLVFFRKLAAHSRMHGRTVQRMDLSQRLQHMILAVSFIVLAWTGFALRYPDSWVAHSLGSFEDLRRWSHRVAGVVLLLGGFYHVYYLLAKQEGRRLFRDMFPTIKDIQDVLGMAKYLLGMSPVKPQFARFGYAEKMEYWAVVWGTIIMGVTGLIVWFKMEVTHFLPRWVVDVAITIHYYEAILACLAILVWHFYHVIFDPDVYPLNRACLDGRVTPEWHEEEHPLDHAAHSSAPKKDHKTTVAHR